MKKRLHKLAAEYAFTESGKWLRDFRWQDVPVEFRKLDCGIVGFHSFGKIVLMEVPGADFIFDIYIHELRHVWQWKTNPLRYIAGKVYRPLIEKDADQEEQKAIEWINTRTAVDV